MRLVHLTDPHLSTLKGVRFSELLGKRASGYLSWNRNRRHHYLPAVLERLVEAVKAENADQILLTGDLVQIGLASEIGQAAAWLGGFGPPGQIMLVPGNHDIYARGSAAEVFRAWSDYLFQSAPPSAPAKAAERYPVQRRLGKITLIGLSTACVTPVFMASGRLGHGQLGRLETLLHESAQEGQTVVLLIHHPPLPGMTNRRKGLADAAALRAILQKHPPALVFYGHLHHNHEQQLGETRLYCTAAASSAGDASYRVIDIAADDGGSAVRMRLKTLSVENTGAPEFVTIDEQCWRIEKAR